MIWRKLPDFWKGRGELALETLFIIMRSFNLKDWSTNAFIFY